MIDSHHHSVSMPEVFCHCIRARFNLRRAAGATVLAIVLVYAVAQDSAVAGPDASTNKIAPPPPSFQITTINGDELQSATFALKDARIQFVADGNPRSLPLDDVAMVTVVRGRPDSPTNAETQARESNQTVWLVDGSRLSGTLVEAPAGSTTSLRFDAGLGNPLDLPFSAVAAIRLKAASSPAALAEFEQRKSTREPGRDILIIARDDKTVAVPGALESITSDQCAFRVGRKLQTAPLDAIVGVILGSKRAAAKPPAQVTLQNDNTLAGAITAADRDSIFLTIDGIGSIDLPWSVVRHIEFSSGRIVSLLDLAPVTTQVRTLLSAPWSIARNTNLRGQSLSIRGRVFRRGLGVHAYTLLAYDLDGKYERFSATVGIDDSAAPAGSVVFRVKLDGRPVFESPVVRGADDPLKINIQLNGARLMELECDPTDDLDFADHAVWASPVLVMPNASDAR